MNGVPIHGGGLEDARRRWPDFTGDWLDLSTGINPWPYPIPELNTAVWSRLPDRDLDRALILAAADYYRAPSPDHVLAGPGTGPFIRSLPYLLPPKTVAILGPTYSEHARSWSEAGHRVSIHSGLDTVEGADAIVVVNPNNPDGRIVDPAALAAFAEAHPDCLTVVDQAFGDVAPDLSIIPRLPGNVVALASFGKFFGLAGLRLGFACAHPHLLGKLTARLGPWPVSGPALAVGAAALKDRDWITANRRRLSATRKELDQALDKAGLTVLGGTDLFRLIDCGDAHLLWDRLGRQGILTRLFDYSPTWLRIGLPRDNDELDRLIQALAK